MLKSELGSSGDIIRNYRMEAQFIPYFNQKLLMNEIRSVAQEAIDEVIMDEFSTEIIK